MEKDGLQIKVTPPETESIAKLGRGILLSYIYRPNDW
jgi:hypothetical protein